MRLAPFALALLLPGAALADCPQESRVFSCQAGTRVLEICHRMGALVYSFGPPGRPDLTLSEPLETANFTPWPGASGSIWETLAFTNQGYVYEVWTAVARDPADTLGLQGGVRVLKGDALQAEVTCDQGTASNSLDVVWGLKESIGQCWNFETAAWATACN